MGALALGVGPLAGLVMERVLAEMRAMAPRVVANEAPAPAIVFDLGGASYTFRFWSAEQWAAMAPEKRPGEARLMDDGRSWVLATLNPMARPGRLFA